MTENNDQTDLYEHHRIVVDRGQQMLRIDKYLSDRLADTSRTRIQNAADAGNILVDGKPVKSNYKIKPLEEISIVLPHPPRKVELVPENIPLNILYEDDELLILNKAAGMVECPLLSFPGSSTVSEWREQAGAGPPDR